ncbi:(S)-ureidoglycine aminohydrolase [Virgibacillus halotolerans]|uniref:(S)-ureidoglycine aminohydrolase n=1 Tax=Virgibacillus halotolerans TaxID=1071053 RepID=UPI001960FD6F|nr:(S)-ureidoglycine aminohydrolase [Virgibacillus halotolerans]MBM7601885.1 (S)-ureidoglycine aminohydrolase [Virgibacillus halotolerans]
MGYPQDLLSSRSIIKHGKYALIAPEGLVKNVVPGFEESDVSILSSPKLGASFVDYIITMHKGGKNTGFAGQADVQSFLYVIDGKLKATADNEEYELEQGGYIYCPAGTKLAFENLVDGDSKVFLYKQKYTPLEGVAKPKIVTGNTNDIPEEDYDGMTNMRLQDLLPTDDLAFDMNFHILTFDPAGSHPFIETHVQEHGAYLLSGEGLYNLDNEWIPVKKDDYIFMGPYVQQACYAVGREKLSYIYSKDCNRDPEL